MTDAQRQALETVHRLLGEHFDAAIVACVYDDTTSGDSIQHDNRDLWYYGGLMTCIGLAEWSKLTFLNERPEEPE